MGGRNLLMRKLRRQHWYSPVVAALAELCVTDYEFVAPTGTGHPKLVLTVNDRTRKIPVPSTGKGHTNYAFLVGQVRDFVTEARR